MGSTPSAYNPHSRLVCDFYNRSLAGCLVLYRDKGLPACYGGESWEDHQGLHMLQPYDPNKIPVVFVHGLMSSPETWLSMFNSLLADTRIRQNYQFWFFMYPTGNPIAYSASMLRESLKEAQEIFDPEQSNPNFNRMVLLGHSMEACFPK